MLKPYRTIQDALASHWVLSPSAEIHQKTDRVLRSTKLESSIYHDLRTEDAAMDEIEQDAEKKLKSFSALSQDVFQSFYSLAPRRNEEPSLSVAARKFNAPILEHMTKSEEYPTLKEVCEGRELPAYEAASEFVSKVSGELDDLLPQLAGKQGALHTLEKLERAEQQAARRLYELLEQRGAIRRDDPVLDEAVVKAANEVDGKHRQVEAVTKLIDDSALHDEAVPLGVAKDGSLAALLEHMGLGRENLMACGDGLNDRSMIEYAGVGVAMQNAEEPVKAVADYVTAADNDHDGVAEAVEKFIL